MDEAQLSLEALVWGKRHWILGYMWLVLLATNEKGGDELLQWILLEM
jgi:hypothetical protein